MHHINIIKTYEKGLADFAALSPTERDFFVVYNLDLWFEMEGSFEDYFLNGSYDHEIAWLVDTLARINDEPSAQLVSQMRKLNWDNQALLGSLSRTFYARRDERWHLLAEYLKTQDVVVDA